MIINNKEISRHAAATYVVVPHKALSYAVLHSLFSSSRLVKENIRILNSEFARLNNEQVQELASSSGQPYKIYSAGKLTYDRKDRLP